MPEVTVVVDTREKHPLLFPSIIQLRGRRVKILTEKIKLDTGDYCIKGLEGMALIERKASIRELFSNFIGKDKKRFLKCIDRLAKATDHPILFLETSASELLMPTRYLQNPAGITQMLFDECAKRGIQILLVGACKHAAKRRIVGELITRLMISYMDCA